MVVAGQGFALMPEGCVSRDDVVARPLVDPEFWRQVNLVTVRGRPHSPAVSLLAREAMRLKWRCGRRTDETPADSVVVGFPHGVGRHSAELSN
jgi:DNA-binding transcriptional LysR family regulator